ncbi:MAG: adenine-specific methyltransferase EcoRI family protein [Bacteroidales bacterium]|nr:adenine-specific methyltransferase EcoRI family protein [Bacteroidales bacterium]
MMAGKNNSKSLSDAKAAKKDEFYTQMDDIAAEMRYHRNQFKGQVVLCNCDDPFESNFFKYFALNFNKLGLKKLIATCYATSPFMYTQLTLFGEEIPLKKGNDGKKPYKVEITEVTDENGDGAIDLTDVKYLLKNKKNVLTILEGDGDFRSEECIALLNEADIVVTNPPFSLWIPYMKLLLDYKKKFLILGNLTGVTYKEIFPHIKNNELWLGQSIHSGDREFRVPDSYPLEASGFRIGDNGEKYIRVKGVRWYTNLDTPKRHDELDMHKKYTPDSYITFDNYDAINVDSVVDIPRDYFGNMGVPISFIDVYNPDQFVIVGVGSGNMAKEIGVQRNYRGRTDLAYTIDGKPKCPFGRIIIRRKNDGD